ncbi:hypothetical protein L7F22_047021 [Adiantum nelumboides]|nr:hypothetical protein [Adiantum nelumboides]
MLHQDVRMDFSIFVEKFEASWKQLEIATGCCGHEFFKMPKFLECLHPRIREKVEFDADTYEGIVKLAKMKSRKVKQKLELGMLKPADYVPVAATVCPVVQPRVAPYVQRVEPVESVIETESDEARLSGDAETGHVQEEQVDELASYGVGCEDMAIENAASVELSKNMTDRPWDPKQVIFVEPKQKQAMDRGELAKEVCASLLMEMLLDVAMQLAFRRLQECLERISALYGWEGRSDSGWKAQHWEPTSSVDHLKSTMKPSNMEISTFDEYKVKTAYADLYVAKRSLPDASTSASTAQCMNEDKKKASREVRSGSQSVRNANVETEAFVDFRDLLMNFAQFVAMGDLKKAREIVQKLYHIHGVSAKGNGLQCTAHFFCEALLSRMGGHRDETLGENTLSVASFIRSGRIWYEVAPYSKVMHYFANQTILKAAKGASRLHVLNYGMFFGMQWPCLINALADREGGTASACHNRY